MPHKVYSYIHPTVIERRYGGYSLYNTTYSHNRYKQCLTEVWAGFEDQGHGSKERSLTREDRVHGSLLVLNELLRCSNNEWERLTQQLQHLTHYQAPPPKKVRWAAVKTIKAIVLQSLVLI